MSSPYSSNLLQQSSTEAPAHPRPGTGAPQLPQHTRSVTHVVAQPQFTAPQYAPVPYAPQPAYAAPRSGGSASNVASILMLGLIVLLVGAVALIGGYYAMRSFAPTSAEAAAETSLAMRSGYEQGRMNGMAQGRQDGAAAASGTAQLKSAIARQKAYDAAYQRGQRAGANSYRRPRAYTGYRGSGYRAPRYSFPSNGGLTAALGSAQSIANATGAPVDVQVFG